MRFLNLFGPPNIEKLKSKKDLEGLIKAMDYPDQAPRLNAMVAAIKVLGSFDFIDDAAARRRVLDGIHKRGTVDDIVDIFVKSINRELPGYRTDALAVDLLKEAGQPPVDKLLSFLSHPDESKFGFRYKVIDTLGMLGRVTALRPIVTLAMGYEPGPMLGVCWTACANLYLADPQAFRLEYAEFSDKEREFLTKATALVRHDVPLTVEMVKEERDGTVTLFNWQMQFLGFEVETATHYVMAVSGGQDERSVTAKLKLRPCVGAHPITLEAALEDSAGNIYKQDEWDLKDPLSEEYKAFGPKVRFTPGSVGTDSPWIDNLIYFGVPAKVNSVSRLKVTCNDETIWFPS